jgi:hypothetical protein
MRWIVAVLLTVHGLIHMMGFAKAFGYAELPQLDARFARTGRRVAGGGPARHGQRRHDGGVAAHLLDRRRRRPRDLAVGDSLGVDRCGAGTIVNVVFLLAVAYAWFNLGPRSFDAQFERDVAAGLAHPQGALAWSAEIDLAQLPAPVQRYLRATGAVGRPRVRNYRLRFRGRIRSGPGARWMPFDAEQQSFADQPARLFLMHARMFALPVEVFHRRIGGEATMQVKLAGAIPMVDARGEVMDAPEFLRDSRDKLCDGIEIGHVYRQGEDLNFVLCADLFRRRIQLLLSARAESNVSAFGRKGFGGSAPHAIARSADDRDLTLQP